MLKINRLVTDNSHSYQDVKLIDYRNEQAQKGIDEFITQPDLVQILIETKEGERIILSDWMVGVLEVRHMRNPLSATRVKRVVINGDISHAPAYLIKESDYKKLKIPRVFKYQFAFTAEGCLHICHQNALLEIIL
jgi:hypothetical protein